MYTRKKSSGIAKETEVGADDYEQETVIGKRSISRKHLALKNTTL